MNLSTVKWAQFRVSFYVYSLDIQIAPGKNFACWAPWQWSHLCDMASGEAVNTRCCGRTHLLPGGLRVVVNVQLTRSLDACW